METKLISTFTELVVRVNGREEIALTWHYKQNKQYVQSIETLRDRGLIQLRNNPFVSGKITVDRDMVSITALGQGYAKRLEEVAIIVSDENVQEQTCLGTISKNLPIEPYNTSDKVFWYSNYFIDEYLRNKLIAKEFEKSNIFSVHLGKPVGSGVNIPSLHGVFYTLKERGVELYKSTLNDQAINSFRIAFSEEKEYVANLPELKEYMALSLNDPKRAAIHDEARKFIKEETA